MRLFLGMEWAAVAFGGAIGATLRFAINRWWSLSPMPWATFVVNLAGSFGLAFLATYVAERFPLADHWRLGLSAGFFGALTTYSTFNLEVLAMLREGRSGMAALYVMATCITCLVAGWLGLNAGHWGRVN
ncbi:MAG: fluoride efflux transporter CrcB [Myxococcota bacterium]